MFLNSIEKKWLNNLIVPFYDDNIKLKKQIKISYVKRYYNNTYFSIIFFPIFRIPSMKIEKKNGVPLEMNVFLDKRPPISFLLHIKDGYIDELEVFSNDLKEINIKDLEDLSESQINVTINY